MRQYVQQCGVRWEGIDVNARGWLDLGRMDLINLVAAIYAFEHPLAFYVH